MLHASRLATCQRLQRVHRLLSDGNWHSTLDIIQGASVCAVNTCIAELRSNGIPIETRREGRRRWYYRIAP